MHGFASRSEFVQAAVQRYLDHLEKLAADTRDIEIINRNAERLNREAQDALSYQADL